MWRVDEKAESAWYSKTRWYAQILTSRRDLKRTGLQFQRANTLSARRWQTPTYFPDISVGCMPSSGREWVLAKCGQNREQVEILSTKTQHGVLTVAIHVCIEYINSVMF